MSAVAALMRSSLASSTFATHVQQVDTRGWWFVLLAPAQASLCSQLLLVCPTKYSAAPRLLCARQVLMYEKQLFDDSAVSAMAPHLKALIQVRAC